jgi:hypothetical protein
MWLRRGGQDADTARMRGIGYDDLDASPKLLSRIQANVVHQDFTSASLTYGPTFGAVHGPKRGTRLSVTGAPYAC